MDKLLFHLGLKFEYTTRINSLETAVAIKLNKNFLRQVMIGIYSEPPANAYRGYYGPKREYPWLYDVKSYG